MIKNSINAIIVNLENVIDHKTFCKIKDEVWNDIIPPNKRKQNKFKLLEVFFVLITHCKELEKIENKKVYITDVVEELLGLFRTHLVSEDLLVKYSEVNVVFLKFLYLLKIENHITLKESLGIISEKLIESISDFKHIFHLKDDEDRYIFSLENLILIVTEQFDPNKMDLLPLTFTVSLKSGIKCTTDNDAEKLNKLIHENNFEYLNLLLNGNGFLVPELDWIQNYKENNVICVVTENEVLIRSTNKSYFNRAAVNTENKDLAQPGYYVKYPIEKFHLMSFVDYLKHNNDFLSSIEVINNMISNGYYNVFHNSAICIDQLSGRFICVMNPYSNNDSRIITNGAETLDDRDHNLFIFLKYLGKISKENIVYLFKNYNYTDIITLNYLVEILKVIRDTKNIELFLLLIESNASEEEISNVVDKSFFDLFDEIESNISQIENMIVGYTKIQQTIFEISDTDGVHHYPILSSKIPKFKSCEAFYWLYRLLNKNDFDLFEIDNCFTIYNGTLSKSIKDIIIITKEKKFSKNDYKFWLMNEDGEIEEVKQFPMSLKLSFVISKCNKHLLIIHQKNMTVIDKMQYLGKISETTFDESYLIQINKQRECFEKVSLLVENAGYSNYHILKYFRNQKISDESKKFVVIAKILNHLYLHKICISNYGNWLKLILEYHYFEPAMIDVYHDKIREFFAYCFDQFTSHGALIVPFKSMDHDPTIYHYYKHCFTGDGGRDWFSFIFDSSRNSERIIQKDDGKYYINCGKNPKNNNLSLIKKIIFLTDIIMTGNAANKILNNYLATKNMKGVDLDASGKSQLLSCNQMLNIPQLNTIIENNNVDLEVASIYIDKNTTCFNANGFTVRVNKEISCVEFDKDEYYFSAEATNKINILYQELYNQRDEGEFCCMVRKFNMPAKYLKFLTSYKDTPSEAALFRRKHNCNYC